MIKTKTKEVKQAKASRPKYIFVESAGYLRDYVLCVVFNDRTARVVDFGPFLKKTRNAMSADFMDIKKFKQFTIKDGLLFWSSEEDEYAMIFRTEELYSGKINYEL